jgi:hypothetical protein
MARKELAGLAALGALAMMANRSKKGEDTSGMGTGGFEGIKNLSRRDTGMSEKEPGGPDFGSEKEPDENYAGLRTSSVGVGTVTSPRMKTPAVRPRTTPMTGSGGGRGPAAGEAEAYRQKQFDEANARAKTPEGRAERAKMESSQALEAVRPEEAMIGGGGLKTVAAMARGLANRKGAAKLAEYSTPQIGMSRPMLPKPGQTYGEGFVMNRKKGGEIKMAKGGMARSSASSRADGIASKGKTRGRMR